MKKRGICSKAKSQVAPEYLIIAGLVFVILIPTAYLLVTYKESSADTVQASKIESVANEIVQAANNLFNYGLESQEMVDVTLPEGIESISFQGNELVFTYKDAQDKIHEVAKKADPELVGVKIENPMEGAQKLRLINLNLRVCITLPDVECPFCPGVEVCDEQFYCSAEMDYVCPNSYFPEEYLSSGGQECKTTLGEDCYDLDCEED